MLIHLVYNEGNFFIYFFFLYEDNLFSLHIYFNLHIYQIKREALRTSVDKTLILM